MVTVTQGKNDLQKVVQMMVWSRHGPPVRPCFGVSGDVWVTVPAHAPPHVHIMQGSHWAETNAGLMSLGGANIKHPSISDRELCFHLASGFFAWMPSPTARRHRKKLVEPARAYTNATILPILYNAYQAALHSRQSVGDPLVSAHSCLSSLTDATLRTLADLRAATGPHPTLADPDRIDRMLYEVIDEGHAQESTVPQEAAENGFETDANEVAQEVTVPLECPMIELDTHLLPGPLDPQCDKEVCLWWGHVATILPFAVDRRVGAEASPFQSLCISHIYICVLDSGPALDLVGC